ncbi:LPS export ABC transporter periplasmic protein LptC [Bacteroidia bacterium]|nr:LPS export ABC transporter periplasmic protein LptC [Bacteroidia bacterium]GHT05935.1 LPS export ABC transporter periplasmic protein LptC [Bacteroidia bacterium]
MLSCALTVSCSRGKTGTVELDAGALPNLHGEDIISLISDSGITRLRLITKAQDIYSNDTNAYWHFPKGIYVEQFDSLFQVTGHVKADTAYRYDKTGLWRLIGNVFLENVEGTTCETSELFWREKEPAFSNNSIYTDKFVKITTKDKIITAQGMKSNQSLTDYVFYGNALETTIDEDKSGPE